MEVVQKRLCKHCGDLLRGRSDKLFCDDLCRNRHHNHMRKKPTLSEGARAIQRVLIKNHRIILMLLKQRRRRFVKRDTLIRAGFVFEIFSHNKTDNEGSTSIFCLDVGYRVVTETKVLLFIPSRRVGVFRWSGWE